MHPVSQKKLRAFLLRFPKETPAAEGVHVSVLRAGNA